LPGEHRNSRLPVFEWPEIGHKENRQLSGVEDKERQDTADSLVSEIKMYTQQTHTRLKMSSKLSYWWETCYGIQTAHKLLNVKYLRTMPWWCLEGVGVKLRKFLTVTLDYSSRSNRVTYSFGGELAKSEGVQNMT
jgi:hypothetical protein